MRKISKGLVMMAFAATSFFALDVVNAQSMEGGGGAASCSAGSTKLCFIVTVNGNQSAQCNETQGSTKDCA